MTPNFSRRKALLGLGATLGSVALTSMLDADENESQPERPSLHPKKPMHLPKAKRVIMLCTHVLINPWGVSLGEDFALGGGES